MAINFPNSPIVGQVVTIGLNNYAWNGTAWQIPQSAGAGGGGTTMTTDDVAPTGAVDGQLWWKSDTGGFYVYYDDGNSQQWVEAAAPAVPAAAYAMKTARRYNLVINGALNVSQENGNTEGTTGGYYAADQFLGNINSTGAYGFARIANANLSGSQYRLRYRITTAQASLAAGNVASIQTRLEGLNVQDLGWLSATSQKDAVLAFNFNGPAGTYCASIRNWNGSATTHSFVAAFTITAGQANTDTVQTIKVPAPGAMTTWAVDTTVSIYLDITLAAGSTYLAPATGWNSGNFQGVTGMSNGLAAVQSFQVWDIGLYADPDKTGVAPSFEVPDYTTEFAKCQRYFEVQRALFHNVTQNTNPLSWMAAKRVIPSLIIYQFDSGSGGTVAVLGITGFYQWVNNSAITIGTVAGNARM